MELVCLCHVRSLAGVSVRVRVLCALKVAHDAPLFTTYGESLSVGTSVNRKP